MQTVLVKIRLRFADDVPNIDRRFYLRLLESIGAERVGNSFTFLIPELALRELFRSTENLLEFAEIDL